jgi:hypothetical protein
VGCVFGSDDACIAAIERALREGLAPQDLHVGAEAAERASEIARRTGAQADLAAEDPFRGLRGYADASVARRAMDRAGLWGAAIGAFGGLLLSRGPVGRAIPVTGPLQPLADILTFFVFGLFIGSILGGALAPQPSVHAAFRLIDGMHDGALALVAVAPAARQDEIARLLEDAGGTGTTRL